MREALKKHLLLCLAWVFVALGLIGVFLPIVPTTPFLIVALGLFSKSSPRFHQMLLNNRWVGAPLRQWEESKSIARKTKVKASLLILVTFAVSIGFVITDFILRIVLVSVATILLIWIWSIKEGSAE